jgi:hypothetical protein
MVRIDVGYWALVVGILRLTDVPAPSRVHSYVIPMFTDGECSQESERNQ